MAGLTLATALLFVSERQWKRAALWFFVTILFVALAFWVEIIKVWEGHPCE